MESMATEKFMSFQGSDSAPFRCPMEGSSLLPDYQAVKNINIMPSVTRKEWRILNWGEMKLNVDGAIFWRKIKLVQGVFSEMKRAEL